MTSNTILRRQNGQFKGNGIFTHEKRKETQKRRTYIVRIELINRQNFDSFIKFFFLRGAKDDWIPLSSTSGPLADLVKRLFKKTFLLSTNERSHKLHLAYAEGDPGDIKPIDDFPRISTRDANFNRGPSSRVRIFEGRRLPLIENYSTEIEPVRAFVTDQFDRGFLKVSSIDEAFSICLEVIKSYVMVDGKRSYKGYPKMLRRQARLGSRTESPSVGHGNNSSADLVTSDSANIGNHSVPDAHSQQDEQPRRQPTMESSDSVCLSRETGRNPVAEHNDVTNRENEALSKSISILSYISHNDFAFCSLALLFGKEIANKYEMVAAGFMRQAPMQGDLMQGDLMDQVSKDIVLYAQWQWFGIKDREEHERRFESLRVMFQLATEAREAYGLKPYSEMRDIYL